MKRYILTGTPGSGKTFIIRALEMTGATVVNEAATDIIAYKQMQDDFVPWEKPDFIDDIISLQKHRQLGLNRDYSFLQFYDRSPLCTYALAVYLGFIPSVNLVNEIERIHRNHIYEKRVFFIQNLGFMTNTPARKISYEDALRFEKIHLDSYKKFDYECLIIPAASVQERVELILKSLWLSQYQNKTFSVYQGLRLPVMDQAQAYTASVNWLDYGEAREKIENDNANLSSDEGIPTFNRVLKTLKLSDIPA